MTSAYQLASFDPTTRFDRPSEVLEVPATLRRGREVPMWLCEGAVPPPRRLLRLTEPAALLGLRLNHRGGLRVRLALVTDDQADAMWQQAADLEGRRGTVRGRPRTVEVLAQGVHRTTVVLVRSGGDPLGRQVVELDIEPDDLAEGRLVLELTSPATPDSADPSVVPASSVGVAVGWMELTALDLPPV